MALHKINIIPNESFRTNREEGREPLSCRLYFCLVLQVIAVVIAVLVSWQILNLEGRVFRSPPCDIHEFQGVVFVQLFICKKECSSLFRNTKKLLSIKSLVAYRYT